jgi:hypothetical protein
MTFFPFPTSMQRLWLLERKEKKTAKDELEGRIPI